MSTLCAHNVWCWCAVVGRYCGTLFKWLTAHWCGSTFGLSCSTRSVFAGLASPWWQACCNTATVNYQVNAATLWNAHWSPLVSSLSSSWFSLLVSGKSLSCSMLHFKSSNSENMRVRMVHMPVHSTALQSCVSLVEDGFYKHAHERVTVKIHEAQKRDCFSIGLRNLSPNLPYI